MNYARVLIIFLCMGCGLENVDETDPRVQTAVQEEITQRKNKLRRNCRAEIVERAEAAVDSTLRAEALKEKLSVFNPPEKPDKPSKPIIPSIEDSLNIEPIKKDPNRKDTLNNFQ